MLKHVDMQLFPCRCCGKSEITNEMTALLYRLEAALEEVGWGVRVNCGFRCAKHNAEVGGVLNSRHMKGEAVDLAVMHPAGVTPKQLADFINIRLGGTENDYQGGLGLYRWGCHLDIGKHSRWNG